MNIATKTQVRAQILAARRSVSNDDRASDARALCRHLPMMVSSGDVVCGYAPVGTEPGSIALLDAMVAIGATVLLPVARTTDGPQPLLWGEYQAGELVTAAFGLLEPSQPWLPPEAISTATTLLIPALAVDRSGVRLGRGAGFYDRSLPQRNLSARLVAVVRDEELVHELPSEPHDVRMTHALTPLGGLIPLPHRRETAFRHAFPE